MFVLSAKIPAHSFLIERGKLSSSFNVFSCTHSGCLFPSLSLSLTCVSLFVLTPSVDCLCSSSFALCPSAHVRAVSVCRRRQAEITGTPAKDGRLFVVLSFSALLTLLNSSGRSLAQKSSCQLAAAARGVSDMISRNPCAEIRVLHEASGRPDRQGGQGQGRQVRVCLLPEQDEAQVGLQERCELCDRLT